MKTTIPVMLVAVAQIAALHAAEIRYADVIYLDDWNQPPLHLKVMRRTPLLFSRDSLGFIGYLAPGQSVEVTGLGEDLHWVVARVATGPATGWVDASALEPPPAEFLAKLRQRREKTKAHRDVIERHEVTTGMTRLEVRASLGKPGRTVRLQSKLGEEERWLYVTYKYVPHYTQKRNEAGQLRQIVSYQRVPAGHRIVTFREDEVVEVADDQTEESRPPPAIVTPPARVGD
jgi:hypothetical protein